VVSEGVESGSRPMVASGGLVGSSGEGFESPLINGPALHALAVNRKENKMSTAAVIFQQYFGSEAGRQRMEDAWLQFPDHKNGGGDLTNAADYVMEGMALRYADEYGHVWESIEAELRPMVESGLSK